MKKLKAVLLGALLIGLSTTSFGMASNSLSLEDQLQSAVVVPIDYHDKVFIGGEYTNITGEYRVELKNNRTYLPIRLMTTVLSKGEEHWDAHWDATKPNEVILYCYHGTETGAGWTYSMDTKTTIKLQVGSNTMIYNGERIELSNAPQKINGRIVLPIRAIGEALKKQINYNKGLVFISNDPLTIQGAETDGIINELRSRLQDPRQPISGSSFPVAAKNIDGKSYYVLFEYNEKNQGMIQRLYSQYEGKAAVVEKELSNYINIHEPIVNNTFYYMKNDGKQMTLHALDLITKKETIVAEINSEGADVSWIGRIIPKGDQTYFIVHYGDMTMGAETLYSTKNGAVTKLTNAKYFGSILFEGDKIYFSNYNFHATANNLFVYDQITKSTTKLGEDGYTYDINRVIKNGGVSLGISNTVTILDGKLYTLGYKEDSQDEASLYTVDLETGTIKKLMDSISKFWVVKDKIYYMDNTTKYLYTSDLDGKYQSVSIKNPITQIHYDHGDFYYTLDKGLFKYNVAQNTHTTISQKTVKTFFIHSSRIYAVISGYDAGLYKIQNGTSTMMEKHLDHQYLFDGENMIYYDLYEGRIEANR